MKGNYVKPTIYFEDFELSQSIATGCKLLSSSKLDKAPVYDPVLDITIYTEATCDYEPAGPNDTPCYDVPTAGLKVFSS